MARIRKEDHQRILQMVDGEHRKVPDIAAEFGCTPANIYALVGKLRRQSTELEKRGAPAQVKLALADETLPVPVPCAAPVDRSSDATGLNKAVNVVAFERTDAVAEQPRAAAEPSPPRAPAPPPMPPAPTPRRPGKAAPGTRLAKQGYGLVMRTAEGEETVAPFRSLDDLLSAVKPILRSTANSSEPVWFSLQPIDLATLDMDAA